MGDVDDVLVVVGAGSMGVAAVRRRGPGAHVLLADVGQPALDAAAGPLQADGYRVSTQVTDVSDAASVAGLAKAAGALGSVRALVHTAGLSPVQASADRVMAVDLVGVALVLAAFEEVVAPGGAGVVIASMAGHLVPPMSNEDAAAIRAAAPGELADVPCVAAASSGDSGLAYAFAKQAVRVRVAAASVPWGKRGARINSISPGVIATPMGHAELASPSGELMRMMVDASGTGRLGTPDDIAAATDFLLGPAASFVTGTDLLVDGGAVAAVHSGALG
jgi:NAD(P)-dependent dehydrogenase (short-subunit alcohol dehydrogenase family)